MPSSATFDPYPVPLSDQAVQLGVFRYNPKGSGSGKFLYLPNVEVIQGALREGPRPQTARFRYLFDDSVPSTKYPTQFDQVWPLSSRGPYVVQADDRLCVFGFAPSGAKRLLWDGFAQVPQVDLTSQGQEVTFAGIGTPIRCWDIPIKTAWYRQGDKPTSTDAKDVVPTQRPVRFNPDKHPNATPDGYDTDQGKANASPAFLDENIDRTPDPRTFWKLGELVRYLLRTNNDESFVKNPDFGKVDKLLKSRKPTSGDTYDLTDSSTYTEADIEVRDFDATNMGWPDAIDRVIGYEGFTFQWVLKQDENDEPVHTFEVYRKDASDPIAPRDLFLQPRGKLLDPGLTNVSELHVQRDQREIANAFIIETDPVSYEVAVVLAPAFSPAAGDESDGNRKTYLRANLADASGDDRAKYREYVADEAGDGHYDYASSTFKKLSPLDLTIVFGKPDKNGPKYANRLRPGDGTLVTLDSDGKPRKSMLFVSRDWSGTAPVVWDGKAGHWQEIDGGWELMKDRLGIRVTAEDVEQWHVGHYTGPNPQVSGKVLRGVTSQANPSMADLNTQRFYLMLVCVIEGDLVLDAHADKRSASPTQFAVTRRIDAKDHFQQRIVTANSWYNKTAKPKLVRDDQKIATAHAEALRAAHEFPPLAGSVTIPWLANGYQVGMRIRSINGRAVNFQANAATGSGESPAYPYIVGLTWDFTGGQRTTLEYSDAREEPRRV